MGSGRLECLLKCTVKLLQTPEERRPRQISHAAYLPTCAIAFPQPTFHILGDQPAWNYHKSYFASQPARHRHEDYTD